MTPPSWNRRRFLAALGCASASGASVALAGCGYRPGGGDLRWREETGGFGRADVVDVAGSTLYTVASSVLSYDFDVREWYSGGRVAAIRTTDGEGRWTEHFEARFSAYTVDDEGGAAAFEETVALFGADGIRWRAPANAEVRELAVAADRAYARTTVPSLVVLADGERVDEIPLEATTGDRTPDPLVAAGDDLVVAADGSGLTAFDPSGSRRWHHDGRVERATVADDGVYVTTGTRLLALDPKHGDVRWRADGAGADGPPLVTGAGVYIHGRELLVFDREGERQWSVDLVWYVQSESPVAVDDSGVYVVTDPGLVAFDHDGTRRWAAEYDHVSAGPFAVDAGILVVADRKLWCHVR